jgi:hypothetical protein
VCRCFSCTDVFIWGFSWSCIDVVCILLACRYAIAFSPCTYSCLVCGGCEADITFVICKFNASESVTLNRMTEGDIIRYNAASVWVGLVPNYQCYIIGFDGRNEEWEGKIWYRARPRLLLIGNKSFGRHVVNRVVLER